MHNPAILQPVFTLAAWTGFVLLQIPIARFRAAFRREVAATDFKFGESPSVPQHVSIPNRNYMNLLELPVLFYLICLLLYVTDGATATMMAVAWIYLALRVLHSIIHLSYNHVIHRLTVFAVSNVVLIWLWVLAGLQIFSNSGAQCAPA
jgi:hypothetical protein